MDMLRGIGRLNSPGNRWSQSWRRKSRLRWEVVVEKEDFNPGMKEWRVMDDENGESMEPMEEVPFIGLGESEWVVRGWRREAGSWF